MTIAGGLTGSASRQSARRYKHRAKTTNRGRPPEAGGGAGWVRQQMQVLTGGQMLLLLQVAVVISIAVVALCSKELHLETLYGKRQPRESDGQSSPPGIFSFRERFAWLDLALQASRARAALPKIKKAVGTATIDQYGNSPTLVLLNDLTYRPRPMPSVSLATNDDLMQRNAEFYRNEATAPKYVVSLLAARNNRFVPQEDSLVMLELLRRYRPLLVEHHLVLLGRIHTVSPERPKQLIATDEYAWGNRIQIPSADGRLVWCEVEIDSSAAGHLRSFLYKPAPLQLVLKSGITTQGNFKFLACCARVGFLIDPLILNNIHLISAYGIKINAPQLLPPRPDAMIFQVEPAFRAYFHDKFAVSFFAIDRN